MVPELPVMTTWVLSARFKVSVGRLIYRLLVAAGSTACRHIHLKSQVTQIGKRVRLMNGKSGLTKEGIDSAA